MSNIISLDQRRREREQRRIAPQLAQVARLRKVAHLLLVEAEAIEMEACGAIDYELMAPEKVENLRVLHNA